MNEGKIGTARCIFNLKRLFNFTKQPLIYAIVISFIS